MKAQALVPALALAAALLASPLAEADSRHRPERGGRPPGQGYYGRQPSHGDYGQRYYGHRPNYGHYGIGNRYGHGYGPRRPYYRNPRYYAPPPAYYGYGYGGYGYGGYDAYGYGYYPPPPPPRYCPPRPRVGIWFGF
jgi:hypothetical protein